MTIGKTPEYKSGIYKSIYDAMRETFNVPEDDQFMSIEECKRENICYGKDYLGISRIRGWANYYSHVVSSATFSKVDNDIFSALWAWAKRRHRNKNYHWIKNKYFATVNGDNWVFNAGMVAYKGRYKVLRLLDARKVAIKRHIKIRAEAHPYDLKYREYFEERDTLQHTNKSKNWVMAGSG